MARVAEIQQLRTERKRLRRQIKSLRAQLNARSKPSRPDRWIMRDLAKAYRFPYGSMTPGVPGWDDRWRSSSGRRVLFVAGRDYAGSMIQWAHAMNRHSNYAVRLAAFQPPRFGYEADLILPNPFGSRKGLELLCEEADIIHIKEEGIWKGYQSLPPTWFLDAGRVTLFTCNGSNSRAYADDIAFQEHVLRYDARVALTPDLNFPWLQGYIVPHAVDCAQVPFQWCDGTLLAHSPSDMRVKSTGLLLSAVGELSQMPLRCDVIVDVDNAECLERKRRATLFFDQIGSKLGKTVGWYGHSAVEAAIAGVPTISHMSQEAIDGLRRTGSPMATDIEIINSDRTPDALASVIHEFFSAPPETRLSKALETRAWVERHHDYPIVARRLADIYETLRNGTG